MATENTLMAAVLAKGETVLGNAACEPHVQISAASSSRSARRSKGSSRTSCASPESTISVAARGRSGPTTSRSAASSAWPPSPAAMSRSRASVRRDLISIVPAFKKLGVRLEIGEETVHVPMKQQLIVEDDLGGMVPKIEDGPWPAFPSDLTSIAVTVATQAFGTVLMFEKMFENRLFFADKLVVDGRAHHPLRSASRRHNGAGEARRPAHGEPRHPRRHGDAPGSAVRRGAVDDRCGSPDRQGLRAHRRAPARTRRVDRARRAKTRARATALAASITPKPSASVRTPLPDAVS